MVTRRLCNPIATSISWSLMPALVFLRISATLRFRLRPALLCSMLMRALASPVLDSFCAGVSSSLGSPCYFRLRLMGVTTTAFPISSPWKPLSAPMGRDSWQAHELRNEIKQSKQTVRKMRKYLSSVKREKGKVERIKVMWTLGGANVCYINLCYVDKSAICLHKRMDAKRGAS